jgi:hypothetical protein
MEKLLAIVKENVINKPQNYFTVDNTRELLRPIPNIKDIKDIEALFFMELNLYEIAALNTIVRNRYIYERKGKDKELHPYETKSNEWYTLLFEAPLPKIDISQYGKKLLKFSAKMCRKATEIYVDNPNLQLFTIGNLPKLEIIRGLERCKEMKFLEINKCNHLFDYSFIKELTSLIFVNLSDNKNLENLSFLTSEHQVTQLILTGTRAAKSHKNIEILQQLKYLKKIAIESSKKDIMLFREALPNCYVNGVRYYDLQK